MVSLMLKLKHQNLACLAVRIGPILKNDLIFHRESMWAKFPYETAALDS